MMRRIALTWWPLLACAGGAASDACKSSAPAISFPDGCLHTSQCDPGLVCLYRVCAVACGGDADCGIGKRCLATVEGASCVADQQATCGPCPDGTECGVGQTCRTTCAQGGYLTCLRGQACLGAVCVGADPDHDLVGAAAASDAGVFLSDAAALGGSSVLDDASSDAAAAASSEGGAGAPNSGGGQGGGSLEGGALSGAFGGSAGTIDGATGSGGAATGGNSGGLASGSGGTGAPAGYGGQASGSGGSTMSGDGGPGGGPGHLVMAPPMKAGRSYGLAAYLPAKNAIVVAGGFVLPDTVSPVNPTTEWFDVAQNAWDPSPLPDMPAGSQSAMPLTLPDGRVLIAGGWSEDAVLFDPDTRKWSYTGDLSVSRADFTALLLADGTALFAGGGDPSSEIWDLHAALGGAFRSKTPMRQQRQRATGAVLADGRVLIMGGENATGNACETTEIYGPDPDGGYSWQDGVPLLKGRSRHFSATLHDGRIILIGGDRCDGWPSEETFLFDPEKNQWSPGPSMALLRSTFGAALLSDGRILVVGGLNDSSESDGHVEILDAEAKAWTPVGQVEPPRAGVPVVALPNGEALIIGGATSFLSSNTTATSTVYRFVP